ncbi:MAG TPA: phage tail protein [Candidatus Limnocylindrales bacterium]|jgi:phage tail-like protein
MPARRDRSHRVLPFLVDLGTGSEAEFEACIGIDTRARSQHAAEVTLSRGIVPARDLARWVDQARAGDPAAIRTVIVRLRSEDRSAIEASWRLDGARIARWSSAPLNARATDVAIEELTLSCDGIEVE